MRQLKKIMVAFKYYFYNNFLSHFPSYRIRHFYLKKVLKYKIGKRSSVHMGCFFTGRKFILGDHSVINRNCYLDCRVGINIGNNVSVSPFTYIISLGHDPNSPQFGGKGGEVQIKDYVWIGMRTTILPGITLHEGSVTGAASVVTKSLEAYSINVGNPARFLKKRSNNLEYSCSWFPYFNTDIGRS